MSWTDHELRQAIHEAAVSTDGQLYINHHQIQEEVDASDVQEVRHLLTALGIDHQPKPELPTTAGSTIYDVVGSSGKRFDVMTLGRYEAWRGVDLDGYEVMVYPHQIKAFGGVLDLDKVRGEQGE